MDIEQKSIIIQEYLKEYSNGLPVLNTDEEEASKVFSGAIAYATTIFINRLFLGGHYTNTANCEEIAECLKKLTDLITK